MGSPVQRRDAAILDAFGRWQAAARDYAETGSEAAWSRRMKELDRLTGPVPRTVAGAVALLTVWATERESGDGTTEAALVLHALEGLERIVASKPVAQLAVNAATLDFVGDLLRLFAAGKRDAMALEIAIAAVPLASANLTDVEQKLIGGVTSCTMPGTGCA